MTIQSRLMIKKLLFIVLITLLLTVGCTTKIMGVDQSKNITTVTPKVSASSDPKELDIQLDYLSSPTMKQVDFTISSFPRVATVCYMKTIYGALSAKKLVLSNSNQFSYYFPKEPMQVDSISLNFYNENGRLLLEKNFNIEYIRDRKEYAVLERLSD